MITTSKLAGFFAAHAIWCVSDGARSDRGGAADGDSGVGGVRAEVVEVGGQK